MKIHQVKIDFNVTVEITRFVYVYIIEAESLYLIDSGVFGCEKQIIDYLDTIGRDISEIKGIFLTHAHPDHIGSAAWFQENTGCKIYASEGEKRWIEDIDLEFKERPIPNFYKLAGRSSKVDVVVKDGDVIELEDGIKVRVMRTAGHSCDEVSYLIDDNMFIGDSVPVKGDIPIFIDEQEMKKTLDILEVIEGVETYYPAWDHIYSKAEMQQKITEAKELINMLKKTVTKLDDGGAIEGLVDKVCDKLGMPMLKMNPLFSKSIDCLRKEAEKMACFFIVDTYIDEAKGRGSYDDYIEKVKPIVESYGGEYLARSEKVTALSPLRKPNRVIIIRFPSRKKLEECFASDEYRQIMHERIDSVDARALIVEE